MAILVLDKGLKCLAVYEYELYVVRCLSFLNLFMLVKSFWNIILLRICFTFSGAVQVQ